MTEKEQSQFEKLNALDVSDHISQIKSDSMELSYLSWVWGWQEMKKIDPKATREYTTFDEIGPNGAITGRKVPYLATAQGTLVECTVTINGISETESLPVMGFKNKAVMNPDMMQINKAKQRVFVKALALHGIGLYIYAGEDLPEAEKIANQETAEQLARSVNDFKVLAGDFATQQGTEVKSVYEAVFKAAGIKAKPWPNLTSDELGKLKIELSKLMG
ncbi:Sak single strand annealing protein [Lacticaseibacillus saniviri]